MEEETPPAVTNDSLETPSLFDGMRVVGTLVTPGGITVVHHGTLILGEK